MKNVVILPVNFPDFSIDNDYDKDIVISIGYFINSFVCKPCLLPFRYIGIYL